MPIHDYFYLLKKLLVPVQSAINEWFGTRSSTAMMPRFQNDLTRNQPLHISEETCLSASFSISPVNKNEGPDVFINKTSELSFPS